MDSELAAGADDYSLSKLALLSDCDSNAAKFDSHLAQQFLGLVDDQCPEYIVEPPHRGLSLIHI